MFLDSKLRFEIISSLLGKEIKPYKDGKCGKAEDILSVDDFHLHNVIGKRKAARETFIKEEDFFDPAYDCDFTQCSDRDKCTRGDELYKRPKGWYRMALKVNGKYPDGDIWLGAKGWRNHSVPGEWPVSYHGTSLGGATGIIRSNYSAGDGAMYGRGIYSTPDIHVAEREEYAKTFTSKSTGKSYKIILQNRINPNNREICERFDYWLVPVNKDTSSAEERAIVESSIRPYGILIKEVEEEDKDCSQKSQSGDYSSSSDDAYSDGDGSNHDGCDDDYDDDEGENYDHDINGDNDGGDGDADGCKCWDDVEVEDIFGDEDDDDGDIEVDEDGDNDSEDDDDNDGDDDGAERWDDAEVDDIFGDDYGDDEDDGEVKGDEAGDSDKEDDDDDDDGGVEDGCDDGDDTGDISDEVCGDREDDVPDKSDEDDTDIYEDDGEEHEAYDEDDTEVCGDYDDYDAGGYDDFDGGRDDDGDWD